LVSVSVKMKAKLSLNGAAVSPGIGVVRKSPSVEPTDPVIVSVSLKLPPPGHVKLWVLDPVGNPVA
jgi:hypothetical protein